MPNNTDGVWIQLHRGDVVTEVFIERGAFLLPEDFRQEGRKIDFRAEGVGSGTLKWTEERGCVFTTFFEENVPEAEIRCHLDPSGALPDSWRISPTATEVFDRIVHHGDGIVMKEGIAEYYVEGEDLVIQGAPYGEYLLYPVSSSGSQITTGSTIPLRWNSTGCMMRPFRLGRLKISLENTMDEAVYLRGCGSFNLVRSSSVEIFLLAERSCEIRAYRNASLQGEEASVQVLLEPGETRHVTLTLSLNEADVTEESRQVVTE